VTTLLLTPELVTERAWSTLRPRLTRTGRWTIPSAQVDAVHAHFGTDPRDYLCDPRARLVGDAIHTVARQVVAEANRRSLL
jgi:hypothetical protein